MYGLPERLKPVSPAEEQVLLALWAANPPLTRYAIGQKLVEKGWADATLLNFLYRLAEKGWVKTEKQGNKNVYTPTVTRRAYGVAVMRRQLDMVFGGSLPDAVNALICESAPSETDLRRAITVLETKLAQTEDFDFYDPYG